MTVLLAILLAPLWLALVVLALPFQASVAGAVREGEPRGRIRVAWGFGLLSAELSPGGLALRAFGLPVVRVRDLRRRHRAGRARRAEERERKRAAKRTRRRERSRGEARRGGERRGSRGGTAWAHRRPLLRMAARLAGALHPRLRVRGRIGTGDPADTAVLSGILDAAGALPGVELDVELDWLEEVLEGEAEGSARAWAPELVLVAAFLLLEREHRAALGALRA